MHSARTPPQRRFRPLGRRGVLFVFAGLVVAALVSAVSASTAADALNLAGESARAAQANDLETAVAKLEAAVTLRPDFPRLLVDLASAQAAAGNGEGAIASLDVLARMGLHSPIEKSDEFALLRSRPDFQALVKRFAANLRPQGAGDVAFTLRDTIGLIEGMAWRAKSGEFYFGDANTRCIWVRNKAGAMRRLTAENEALWGVYGIVIDETAGALWAATCATPVMQGFTPDLRGRGALAEIDLQTGEVRRTIPVSRGEGDRAEHALVDLAVGPDGTILATDSVAPVLWRLAPGGTVLEPLVESDEFFSLQGVVVVMDGVALVSDRTNGLLRVDLVARAVQRVESPPATTLVDVEGLALAPTGQLLALQSGLRPNRVLRLDLDPAAEKVVVVDVLESGHITMAAPSRGCLATNGDFFYIGNAGRSQFEENGGRPAKPRPVPIFQTNPRSKKS